MSNYLIFFLDEHITHGFFNIDTVNASFKISMYKQACPENKRRCISFFLLNQYICNPQWALKVLDRLRFCVNFSALYLSHAK